jgi:hypothetical protein
LNDLKYLHIDQGGEHNRSVAVYLSGVVNLPNRLVCFVNSVNKWQSYVARFGLKLSQDGITKGFGSYACAIGYKKYRAIWHSECELAEVESGNCKLHSRSMYRKG